MGAAQSQAAQQQQQQQQRPSVRGNDTNDANDASGGNNYGGPASNNYGGPTGPASPAGASWRSFSTPTPQPVHSPAANDAAAAPAPALWRFAPLTGLAEVAAPSLPTVSNVYAYSGNSALSRSHNQQQQHDQHNHQQHQQQHAGRSSAATTSTSTTTTATASAGNGPSLGSWHRYSLPQQASFWSSPSQSQQSQSQPQQPQQQPQQLDAMVDGQDPARKILYRPTSLSNRYSSLLRFLDFAPSLAAAATASQLVPSAAATSSDVHVVAAAQPTRFTQRRLSLLPGLLIGSSGGTSSGTSAAGAANSGSGPASASASASAGLGEDSGMMGVMRAAPTSSPSSPAVAHLILSGVGNGIGGIGGIGSSRSGAGRVSPTGDVTGARVYTGRAHGGAAGPSALGSGSAPTSAGVGPDGGFETPMSAVPHIIFPDDDASGDASGLPVFPVPAAPAVLMSSSAPSAIATSGSGGQMAESGATKPAVKPMLRLRIGTGSSGSLPPVSEASVLTSTSSLTNESSGASASAGDGDGDLGFASRQQPQSMSQSPPSLLTAQLHKQHQEEQQQQQQDEMDTSGVAIVLRPPTPARGLLDPHNSAGAVAPAQQDARPDAVVPSGIGTAMDDGAPTGADSMDVDDPARVPTGQAAELVTAAAAAAAAQHGHPPSVAMQVPPAPMHDAYVGQEGQEGQDAQDTQDAQGKRTLRTVASLPTFEQPLSLADRRALSAHVAAMLASGIDPPPELLSLHAERRQLASAAPPTAASTAASGPRPARTGRGAASFRLQLSLAAGPVSSGPVTTGHPGRLTLPIPAPAGSSGSSGSSGSTDTTPGTTPATSTTTTTAAATAASSDGATATSAPAVPRIPSLQPPRLNLKSLLASRSRRTPDSSPMSATSRLQAATLSTLIATLDRAGYLPSWLVGLIAHGTPSNIRRTLKAVYETIRELEQERLRPSGYGPAPGSADSERFRMRAALLRGHERFNRYTDILPFDYNRVRLSVPVGGGGGGGGAAAASGTDYINASHVVSLAGTNQYITAQGPLPSTMGAFWEMVWEQGCGLVVMLTQEEENGRIKCHRYWPDAVGTSKRYATSSSGGATCFKIQFAEETVLMDGQTLLREFIVKKEIVADVLQSAGAGTGTGASAASTPVSASARHSYPDGSSSSSASAGPFGVGLLHAVPEIRRVRMLHFLAWPDHQVSSPRSVLDLVEIANDLQGQAATDMIILDAQGEQPEAPVTVGPMVVHCSAGCGRTGAFCVIDSVLSLLPLLPGGDLGPLVGTPDHVAHEWERLPAGDLVALSVNHIRRQRVGSVQTLDQFIFCYDAVVTRLGDWLEAGRPPVWVSPATSGAVQDGRDGQPTAMNTTTTMTTTMTMTADGVRRGHSDEEEQGRRGGGGGGGVDDGQVPPTPAGNAKRFSWSMVGQAGQAGQAGP